MLWGTVLNISHFQYSAVCLSACIPYGNGECAFFQCRTSSDFGHRYRELDSACKPFVTPLISLESYAGVVRPEIDPFSSYLVMLV